MVQGYGVPPTRITVVPNGINLQRFAAEPHPEAAKAALGMPGRLVLGFAGFIRGWNAVHRMVDFAAQHRSGLDPHVLVVGDGPAREALLAHARDLGVADRLIITGIVDRDDMARHVAAFDIAVLPGVTSYSSPLKLFEYMQLGRAIVAPDLENIREILTDGHDALLFDPGREGSLEQALLRLCYDAALRKRIGAAARQTISARRLTWDCNAQKVAGIVDNLPGHARLTPGQRQGISRPA
jgi:glycosyltransferase involved in cell wall biosynthesis